MIGLYHYHKFCDSDIISQPVILTLPIARTKLDIASSRPIPKMYTVRLVHI